MSLGSARRQKSRKQLELPLGEGGEASGIGRSGEARTAANGSGRSGDDDLVYKVVEHDNVQRALKRVRRNKGSPGIDGMTVGELPSYLAEHWDEIRASLLAGTYQPKPVRRQQIPKSGGGMRELGIPTVLDRLIQQALLQVLQPQFDPTFSEQSYGFRPGRSAHDAVCVAQRYIQEGRRWVVDVDLEKFFDRVNHDMLMSKLARRIGDRCVLGLIRRFLDAGVMANGVVMERHEGTPQGGPLSPLLANVLLDEVDKELEQRGHAFVRYADDCNVYVRSRRAGERVMQTLRRLYARLRLRINEAKSAVERPWHRKFLGFSFWTAPKDEIRRRVASKALATMKDRVRAITRRTLGRSVEQVAAELRGYLTGWKQYFQFAQAASMFARLDEWIRHRLRALHLKHWKHGPKIFRTMRARGLDKQSAAAVANHAGRWWYGSYRTDVRRALPLSYFDQLGVPRLAS